MSYLETSLLPSLLSKSDVSFFRTKFDVFGYQIKPDKYHGLLTGLKSHPKHPLGRYIYHLLSQARKLRYAEILLNSTKPIFIYKF